MRSRAALAGPARPPEAMHLLIEDAINRADLDAFLDIHDEGANVVVPPDGRTAYGRAEIGRAIAPLFELQPAMTSTVVKKLEATQLALIQRRWHVVLTEHGCRAEAVRWQRSVSPAATPTRASPRHRGRQDPGGGSSGCRGGGPSDRLLNSSSASSAIVSRSRSSSRSLASRTASSSSRSLGASLMSYVYPLDVVYRRVAI